MAEVDFSPAIEPVPLNKDSAAVDARAGAPSRLEREGAIPSGFAAQQAETANLDIDAAVTAPPVSKHRTESACAPEKTKAVHRVHVDSATGVLGGFSTHETVGLQGSNGVNPNDDVASTWRNTQHDASKGTCEARPHARTEQLQCGCHGVVATARSHDFLPIEMPPEVHYENRCVWQSLLVIQQLMHGLVWNRRELYTLEGVKHHVAAAFASWWVPDGLQRTALFLSGRDVSGPVPPTNFSLAVDFPPPDGSLFTFSHDPRYAEEFQLETLMPRSVNELSGFLANAPLLLQYRFAATQRNPAFGHCAMMVQCEAGVAHVFDTMHCCPVHWNIAVYYLNDIVHAVAREEIVLVSYRRGEPRPVAAS